LKLLKRYGILIRDYSVIAQNIDGGRHGSVHIGIVEDNPSIRELLVTTLEMAGHRVETHITGVDFLQQVLPTDGEAAEPFPYDVLILDLGLPGGMSGEDVLARLAQQFTGEPLPVVVLSGADPETLDRVHTHFPTVPILTKPMYRSTLLQTIAETHRSTREEAR
jgi:DNA-binding response OmpR family regulator